MSNLHLPANPSLKDIQNYVRQMESERGFTKHDLPSQCLMLAEEVGELIKCVRKSHTKLGIDPSKRYDFDPGGEVADILIMLAAIANRLNVDIETSFRAKEEQNKQRTWK